ncbi:acyl-CoA dehydrogenase family protein [Pseudonocardia endophytica]|uniref:Alkylation response protein AidB-like acyl-CoA dehydrogenase n=1 Tax=Pseudonocardia endophytica TaxID=401976 RepID=A0A4R1HXU3_PSEEN|nr:acyl-CoA dehydrogenase family protein [Pseudonocardia endophytica]TCK26343.1 alkylation response protein AidB-like acyl-CoA dehydrogenase [Pseudonocardia endophytica]
MRWGLSPEQAAFRSVLADWLEQACPPDALRRWLENGDRAGFEHRLHQDGWFGVGSPEEIGGEGGGLVELAVAAEEMGRHAAPASGWLASAVAIPAVLADPGANGKALADGPGITLASPAGSLPGAPTGIRIDPAGRLTGVVETVLAADAAHTLVVPVGDDDPVLHLVDAAQPGVRRHPRVLTDRSRAVADVHLEGATGAPVPLDGTSGLAAMASRAAVLVAADALGCVVRMLADTVAYVGQRVQFGVPVGSFQAVKHAAADMLVTVESSRSIVYPAAAAVQEGRADAATLAAAAKAQVCGAAVAAADTALTLHGAIGYTWEHDLQFFYKRALLDAELFGSPEAWNDRLADLLALTPGRG